MAEATTNVDARGKPQAMYQTVNEEPSQTVQSDAHEADIKTILKRHGITGITEHLAAADLKYGDISQFTDFADAMRQVKDAEAAFMKLPSKVREVFNHDPATWLDAANDGIGPQQKAKLEKLGYLEVANEVAMETVETVSDGAGTPAPGGEAGGDQTSADL